MFVEHPDQQLVLADTVGAQVEDRLGEEHEAVVCECLVDPVCPGELRLGAAGAVFGGLVEGVLVAAGVLGVVHREVGGDQDASRR